MALLTRTSYDKDSYVDQLRQETNELHHSADLNRYEHNSRCLSVSGPRHKNTMYKYQPPSLIDTDSYLSNRIFQNTNSIVKKKDQYEFVKNTVSKNKNSYFPNECSKFLDQEDSRYTHPKNWYKGLGYDVFYDLQRDPQCGIFWDTSMNTRLWARDTIHPKLPSPIDDNYKGAVPQVPKNKSSQIVSQLGPRKDCFIGLRCK